MLFTADKIEELSGSIQLTYVAQMGVLIATGKSAIHPWQLFWRPPPEVC
jgi:hypothetical protein